VAAVSLEGLQHEHRIALHAWVTRREDALVVAKELRAGATPGVRVVLAQRPSSSAWLRVKGLLGAKEAELSTADVLALALLCAGLEAPTVLADGAELVAVAAQVPSRADPLDDVFA